MTSKVLLWDTHILHAHKRIHGGWIFRLNLQPNFKHQNAILSDDQPVYDSTVTMLSIVLACFDLKLVAYLWRCENLKGRAEVFQIEGVLVVLVSQQMKRTLSGLKSFGPSRYGTSAGSCPWGPIGELLLGRRPSERTSHLECVRVCVCVYFQRLITFTYSSGSHRFIFPPSLDSGPSCFSVRHTFTFPFCISRTRPGHSAKILRVDFGRPVHGRFFPENNKNLRVNIRALANGDEF